jgi:repressor LexA
MFHYQGRSLMENLSSKQGEVLSFLLDFNTEYGFPPTIRELCDHFGFKSLNTAHFHLRSLEKKGYIQIHPGKGRGITLSEAHRRLGRNIPIVGRIVIIHIQNQAKNGDIVAAIIDDEVTLKYFYRSRNQVRLESANPKYPPMIFKKGDTRSFRILGIMAGLVRRK